MTIFSIHFSSPMTKTPINPVMSMLKFFAWSFTWFIGAAMWLAQISVAHAAPRVYNAPVISSEKRGEELYEQGMHYFNVGRYEDALDRFQLSLQIWKDSPKAMFQMARAEQLSGRCVDAVKVYLAYALQPPHPKVSDDDRKLARDYRDECKPQLSVLHTDLPHDTIVYLDGVLLSWHDTDGSWVAPGNHKVLLRSESDIDLRGEHVFDVLAGGEYTISYRAVKMSKPPPYLLEAQAQAQAQMSQSQVSGAYGSEARKNGGDSSHSKPAITRWDKSKVIGVSIVGGLAVVSLVGGISLRVAASSTFSSNRQGIDSCNGGASTSSRCEDLSSAKTAYDVGAVMMVAGGVLGVGAAVMALLWDPSVAFGETKSAPAHPARASLSGSSSTAATAGLEGLKEKKLASPSVNVWPLLSPTYLGLSGRF